MAKVRGNPSLIAGLSGAIGGLVYCETADGLIVRRQGEPKPDRSPTPAELVRNANFQRARAYGNQVKVDPVLAPLYQLVCTGRMTPYQAGFRDCQRPPVIDSIDLGSFTGKPGASILVSAWDDFQVTKLTVLIRDTSNQKTLEQGPATLSPLRRKWVYTTTSDIAVETSVIVEATACDRPGNETVSRVHYFIH